MAKSKLQRDLERAHQATRDAKNDLHNTQESYKGIVREKDAQIANLQRALDEARKQRTGPILSAGETSEALRCVSFLTTLAHRAIGNGHG